jgi:signal peptidase I
MKLKKKYVWLLGVIVLLVVGIFYLRLSYKIYSYPQESMTPTIKKGSLLLVDMKAYKSKAPELQDIVACSVSSPKYSFSTVRRVVGLPKDQISYSSWGGRLLVNGRQIESPPNLSLEWKEPPVKSQVHISTPYTVPSDSYFVVALLDGV